MADAPLTGVSDATATPQADSATGPQRTPGINRRDFLAAATCACALACPFAAAARGEREDDDDDDDDDEKEHRGSRGGRRPPAAPTGGPEAMRSDGARPDATKPDPSGPDAGKVDVGPLSAFTRDGASDRWAASDRFILVRDHGRVYAMTAVCPHKGSVVHIDARNVIHCEKHNSLFDNTGTATKGPATHQAPLERFTISTDSKGHVLVDTSKKFPRDKWDDPAASVKVK